MAPSRSSLVQAAHSPSATTIDWNRAYGKLPLAFEKNQGQADRAVQYLSHGQGYGLLLTDEDAILYLRNRPGGGTPSSRALTATRAPESAIASVVRMHLTGANRAQAIEATDQLPGRTNYFSGADSKKWLTDLPSYARVSYKGIYPGIDLVYYGNQQSLEYDFVVAPGADPSVISMHLDGAEQIHTNAHGDLVLDVSGGQLELQTPVIYQNVPGGRRKISGKYIVSENRDVRIALGEYDHAQPVIVDPVLTYATYLGGSGDETGYGIAVDALGDAFVTGSTFSADFPTTLTAFTKGPITVTARGAVFVTKLNPTGTQQLYSTYLAGTGGESAFAIAVDATGKAYVTGQTFSTDFPTTTNALKPGPLLANASGTSFISKIDPTLTGTASLVYSSYLGGTSGDFGTAIAADAAGNAYVTGFTFSAAGSGLALFPTTTGAFQTALSNASGNAFLTRIDTSKSGTASLIYSTYLGGNGVNSAGAGFGDGGEGVAVDSRGAAYVTGITSSSNFPTTASAFQVAAPLAVAQGTSFVSTIDTTGAKTGAASLLYSTYLGGENSDLALAIALGPNNVAYVTGTTTSLAFPIFPAGAYKSTGSTGGLVFASLIDSSLTGSASLKYSTYLGSGIGFGIRADSLGRALVAGGTSDPAFPVTAGAFQTTMVSGATGGFISQLNPAGSGTADLVYSTFFGGAGSSSSFESINAIALDASNNVYVTGVTKSATTFPVFPKPGAFQTTLAGPSDAFVAKLILVPTITVSPASLNLGTQLVGTTSAVQTVTVTNNSNSAAPVTSSAIVAGSPAASGVDFVISSNTCGATLAAGASCVVSVTLKPSVAATESGRLVVTAGGFATSVPLTGAGSSVAPVTVSPTSLSLGTQPLGVASTAQTVTVTNNATIAQPLTAISIIAGSPAASNVDFAISSNTCGLSVAASSTCTVGITFKPSVIGAESANLVFTATFLTTPLSVSLTGTGSNPPDFSVTAPASLSVAQGASGTAAVTVTSLNGFVGAVALSCSGAPSLATCSISPASVTPAANGTATATLTVTTTAATLVAPRRIRITPTGMGGIMMLMLTLSFLALWTQKRRMQLTTAAAILVLVAIAGCGSSSTTTHSAGTPKGTSNITVTGVSGSQTHTATIALTVN